MKLNYIFILSFVDEYPIATKGGSIVNKNDFSRLKTAINHQEPDRVPLVETVVDYSMQSEFLGKEVSSHDLETRMEFWQKAGYDYIPLTLGIMQAGKLTSDSSIIQGLGITEEFKKNDSIEELSIIKTEKDFQKVDWEKISEIDYSEFENIKEYLPTAMKVIAVSGKIFTLPWMLMGFEDFCESLYTAPKLVEKLIRKVSEIQISAIKNVIKLDQVGAIWLADDLAFGSGLIVSPKHLKEYIYPVYKEIVSICHHEDKLAFFHSDGQVEPIIEDIIEIGFDAIHPIDPNAEGLDIKDIKDRYGKDIAIFGNVDVQLLAEGSVEEVQASVHYLLKNIAPGGGYCLSSGNSVPGWAKLENYKMMLQTVFEDGKYPIKL